MFLICSGKLELIHAVINSPSFDLKNEMVNEKEETPLHLAVKSQWKKVVSTEVLSVLLQRTLIDPSKKDKSGKRPIDYISKDTTGASSDTRITMLKNAMDRSKPAHVQLKKGKKSHQKKMRKKKCEKSDLIGVAVVSNNSSKPGTIMHKVILDDETGTSAEVTPVVEPSNECVPMIEKHESDTPYPGYNSLTFSEKLEYLVTVILQKKAPSQRMSDTTSKVTDNSETIQKYNPHESCETNTENNNVKAKNEVGIKCADVDNITNEEKAEAFDFDDLPWEIEVEPKVVKFFKDTKKYSSTDQWAAKKTIWKLAMGKRNEHLSKRVGNKGLKLFEARMTQGGRILWEEAISYSTKWSSTNNPVYTEVIRVWEIVLHHDNLDKKIKYCIKQIEESHQRGCESSLKLFLSSEEDKKTVSRESFPKTYKPIESEDMDPTQCKLKFVPAASTSANEYTVKTFHSFDTSTVKSLLLGKNDRRDFPFKEWHKEHDVIQLSSCGSILLLGRSGTGKTTCCLYRLWNEFKKFWNPESSAGSIKIPRQCFSPPSALMQPTNHDGVYALQSLEAKSCSSLTSNFSTSDEDQAIASVSTEDMLEVKMTSSSLSCKQVAEQNVVRCIPNKFKTEENLHQVFITKNHVLCNFMKKSFYNMAAAHDYLNSHMKYENESPPNKLSDVSDEAFPLFLTARQFYSLLDNSIGERPTFFEKDKDGNIASNIASTEYDLDYNKQIELGLKKGMTATSHCKPRVKEWIEVTALYFKDHIWKNISNKQDKCCKKFDPMLVWTEIQSFIKGSESALRKGRPLTLQEYKEIGDRMAPSFAGCRDVIYGIYVHYQRHLQNQRHQAFLYDECDLVLHLYNRLKDVQDVPWSIHSLYIDEVQDFTQAELAIFIHCMRDVNSMFFTGDTAQTIMRGVSFRFKDIRSIFYRISKNAHGHKVSVPEKPYNLTINFRSHSGILNLAGSILDLITEFFKDSIDHLPNDVSMFDGPTPVVVESCEVNDLALLLRTNKREVSAIEFGAHQVILVQSKKTRDNLPSILKGAIVFTVFEAKGLEFDDVLLYDFFKDSLVSVAK